MIYDFLDDFCNMKTTVYLYTEYTENTTGKLKQLPLSRPLKKDHTFGEILCSFKLDWLFKDSEYGNTLKQLTCLARTYPHGSIEYNDIKMRMPGYTWNGPVKKVEEFDVNEQDFYEKRLRRCDDNIELNGIVCIEFDDIETKNVSDFIQQALKKFPHLIYAGRTLSNKMFCIHRADNNIDNKNYKQYFMELAVQYYNELGIKCDTGVCDVSRIRYMCDQFGARANMQYCDFSPTEKIEIEYSKIFNDGGDKKIVRASKYIPTDDDTLYEYDDEKGFYYGHGKQHIMHIGELIVPVPSITQMINTLLALDYSRERIVELWQTKLKYYNYNNESDDVSDCISLTNKFKIDGEYKIGNDTYNFICMFFPELVGLNGFFLASNEYLCDRYYNVIDNAISTYKRILIHGDTGIGKTYFANKLGEQKDVIVVVPYIAHMENYKSFTPIELKDVDDVISSGVIIWDRFVKLFNKGLIDNKSIVIIDESHKLFLDQTYRKAAIEMNNILNDIENNICYISATPINEINVKKVYKFEKDRNSVTLKYFKILPDDGMPKVSKLFVNAFLHLIYGNINYYDHIFIASDIYAQKIYDRLYGRFDCQLIRANQKDSIEYLELMKTQKLSHKIIIGTCISYESLNFSNKNEKILTLTDKNDKTSGQIITQISGRVRYSSNTVCLLDLAQLYDKIDFNEYAEYYNKLEEIKSKYNIYVKHQYIQDNPEVLNNVQEWYKENTNIETIKENLPWYIKWKDYDITATMLSDKSPLNIQVKNYIVSYLQKNDDMLNNVSIVISDIDENDNIFFNIENYIRINENGQAGMIIREKIHDEQYAYRKLMEYVDYKKINKMISNTYTLPKGVDAEIKRIIDIIKMDDINYNCYVNELETYLLTLKGIYFYNLERDIKKIKKIRKKYASCINENQHIMYNNVFNIYVSEKQKTYNNKIINGKLGGMNGVKRCIITDKFKHPEKYNLTCGMEFESVDELQQYTHKSRQTLSKWRNKNWIE